MLSKSEFDFEKEICKEIFLGFTNLHLNSAVYGLVKYKEYLTRSLILNSLSVQLESYSYSDSAFQIYLNIHKISDIDFRNIVERIHDYDRENLTGLLWNINGGLPSPSNALSTAGSSTVYYEVIATSNAQTVYSNIPVSDVYYELRQAYLNGVSLAANDFSYANGVFTYTGPVSVTIDDIFRLRFEFIKN